MKENSYGFDWGLKIGNETLLEMANRALKCHISQHQPPVANNSHLWGYLK
jgi:hypothetical protein